MASQLRLLSPSPDPGAALAALSLDSDGPGAGADRAGDDRAPFAFPLPSHRPHIDLDSLRCFDAVATTLRFRSAAARVHLSPAAFSDRIGRLEQVLGTKILERTTRKVALTSAGERLLPVARRVLGLVDHMPGAAVEDGTLAHYQLVVGTRYELGLSWLCGALDALERKRPERTVHLYNGSTEDLLARIERGDLDAAVTSTRLGSSPLCYAALHSEEYALCGLDRRLRGPEDARRLTLVDISPDLPLYRYFLDALPDARPWPFARVEYMGGIANVRQRLLTGDGRIAVLPTFFVKADLAQRRLRRLMPRVTLRSDSLRLIWQRNHPRQAELMALADDLRAFPLR